MTKDITFTAGRGVGAKYAPYPAATQMPGWYRDMPNLIPGLEAERPVRGGSATMKRCVPVFDALTAGYIIPTWVDVYVTQRPEGTYFEWPSDRPLEFHPVSQAKGHPAVDSISAVPKWSNPWIIATPPGYSSLFVAPLHRPNGKFDCMPAIVDTDSYVECINFPFTLVDPTFEGLIPAGTPMIQVIPFRRDDWRSCVDFDYSRGESLARKTSALLHSTFISRYRRLFWSRKSYR